MTRNLERKKPKWPRVAFVGLLMVTLAGLFLLSMSLEGCARNNRPLVHPLPQDFVLVKQGESITFPKSGAYVSAYFLCTIMSIDVDGVDCKDVK